MKGKMMSTGLRGTSRKGPHRGLGAKGFTLIEVMIAAAVFSVGMLAVLTMEFTSLNAFASARDQTVAAELSNRTMAVMRTEMLNWQLSGNNEIPTTPVYGGPSPFETSQSFLTTMSQTPWIWNAATPTPVNEQLRPSLQFGRYCVYYRGGEMAGALAQGQGDVGGMPRDISPLLQVQVAIVYPAMGNTFRGLACDMALTTICGAGLDVLFAPADIGTIPLDTCGYRVVRNAALLRRDALNNPT